MRLTLTVLLLTIVVCGSAMADRKTPPRGVDAGQGIQPTPMFDLLGAPVYNWGGDGCWQGFGFDLNPAVIRPLMYPFVQQHNGVSTQDKRQAKVSAEWGFICFDPRLSGADLGYQSWSREAGVHLDKAKYTVQVTVTFTRCRVEANPYDETEVRLVPGEVMATYVGVGRTNSTIDWGAFLGSFSWARGLNLGFGQSETGDARLQLKALTEAFKNLKPAAPLPPPQY